MAKIVKADEPFERIEEPRAKALELCRDLGQQFKVEHIDDGADRPRVDVVLSAGRVHRSVPRPARAQRRDPSARSSCCRGRGLLEGRRLASSCSGSTAPPGSAKEDLENYLAAVEEAKRRDHRVLGKQLELFATEPAGRLGPDLLAAQGGDDPRPAGEVSSTTS